NLKLVLDWLEGKGVRYKIDFFSGEPMVQESAFRALEMIAERNFVEKIIIPSNFTFILDESLTNRVEALLKRSRELNSPIILSASIDGKYCEENRPFRSRKEDPRNDEYYDKVFKFCKTWGFSFHPMIYSEGIENWKQNFEWFQGMFRKFDIPFNSIYLLEIRNAEWTAPQVRTFAEFIRWLVNWTKDLLGERTVDFLFHRGFNILSNPLATVGRGLGCSIQSTLFIRLGDLSLMPCHRTSYPQFIYGNLETDGEKVTGLNIRNPELMV
ncbi:unnamed protein product, partial [marine sediment metagenome]